MGRWALVWLIGWLTVTAIWFTIGGGSAALRSRASLPGLTGLDTTRKDRSFVFVLLLIGHLVFFAVLWPLTFVYLVYVGVLFVLQRRRSRAPKGG